MFKCESADACPIFSGLLKDREFTTKSYRSLFCESSEGQRNECRRWQCKEKYGSVPSDLLPNAKETVEELGKKFSLV